MTVSSLVRRYWPRSDFVRNVATLVTGTALAQVISIGTAPINSRLYTPADYGALGAYMSVSGLLTTASTLLYHLPVVLTEEETDARDLVGTCLAASCAIAVLALVGVLGLGPIIANHFQMPELRWWLLGIPVGTLCSGTTSSFTAWINRKQGYKALASTRIFTALLPLPATIGLGIYVDGPTGLLTGVILTQLGGAVTAVIVARRLGFEMLAMRPTRMRALAVRYRRFPIFTLPTELIYNFTSSLPVYLLSAFAGAPAVGAYAMSTRLLGLPSSLIGSSIGEVFRQQAAADCAKTGECRRVFVQTAKHAGILSFFGFLFIGFAGPPLFSWALGPQWRAAGGVAQILAPLFCIQFVVSPLCVLYYLRNRLREDLGLHLALIGLIAVSMSLAHLLSPSTKVLLMSYVLAYGTIYIVYFFRSYQLSGPQAVLTPEVGE